MKSLLLTLGAVAFALAAPTVGQAQSLSSAMPVGSSAAVSTVGVVTETRVPLSSGGTIRQRAGRYIKGTYERARKSPGIRNAARHGLHYGLRGGVALATGKAAPIIVAAGAAYGAYEVGKYGYSYSTSE